MEQRDVCIGAIKEMGEVVVPQLIHSVFSPKYFCSRISGFCSKPEYKTLKSQDFVDRLLSEKPEFIANNDYSDKLHAKMAADTEPRKTVKVLHMSDLHLDFEYVVGTNANCGKPVCCREEDGPPAKPEDAAPVFGHPNCDAPDITAESAFKFLSTFSKEEIPELLLWTGDNTPHDVWEQSVQENAIYTIKITEYLERHLPDLPVMAALGNHEFFPVNVMSIDETDPVLTSLANVWAPYLDEEALSTFGKTGYFSTKVPIDNPVWANVRIISLNSAQCNNMNWYLWSQLNDPQGEIAWLENELKKAEANDEVVFVIAHIPSASSDCLHSWSVRFKALVERYQHVVRMQFYGHSHDERWHMNRGFNDGHPIGIQFGSASLGTRGGKNPGFRIFELDAETFLPVQITRYAMDLRQSNEEGKPIWSKMYDTTEEYELEGFSPSQILEFTESWNENVDMVKKYKINQDGRYSHQSIDQISCNEGCIKHAQCDWTTSEVFEFKDCVGSPHIDLKNNLEDSLFELMNDPWVEGEKP